MKVKCKVVDVLTSSPEVVLDPDDCVIIGGGPIGCSAAMVCKTSGATVIVVDPVESRRENALNYGADYVVDPTAGDVE